MSTELFVSTFGQRPTIVASSPGRVNLIGEHTDYNGGEVLPIAIERRTVVAIARADGDVSRVVSANEPGEGTFDARHPQRSGGWWDYLAGVSGVLAARGVNVPQLLVAVSSDVPAGAGLSSSAALEVATGVAISALAGAHLGHREIALLSQRAETEFVGVASGIMDQFASALGCENEALHLWCDTGETEQVPMREAILIFDTAVPRSLRSSKYNDRRAECDEALAILRRTNPSLHALAHASVEEVRAAGLPAVLEKRALHVVTETRRVRETVRILQQTGKLPGELMLASHESLRDLYECSSPELDWFVERAMQSPGITGARLTGAGWGGCAIAAGSRVALESAAPAIAKDYERAFGRTPRTWITTAKNGASVDSIA